MLWRVCFALGLGVWLSDPGCAADKEPAARVAEYDIIFRQLPRWAEASSNPRGQAILLAEAVDANLPEIERVYALLELALSTDPDAIPWRELLRIAELKETPAVVSTWAVNAAGRGLCGSRPVPELERWMFRRMTESPNSTQGTSAIIVLAGAGVAVNSTLREWSKLLRDPATSHETCVCLCLHAGTSPMLRTSFTADQWANCLLAAYDERGTSDERKVLLLEQLDRISGSPYGEELDRPTLSAIHDLAVREFANARNADSVRLWATFSFVYEEPIAQTAIEAAEAVLGRTPPPPDSLRGAAERIVRRAARALK